MTVSVSEAPAATVAGSVAPETVKALFPVEMAEIVALALPVLLITRLCEVVVPVFTLPKAIEEVLACSVAAVPVPLSAAERVASVALLLIASVPL